MNSTFTYRGQQVHVITDLMVTGGKWKWAAILEGGRMLRGSGCDSEQEAWDEAEQEAKDTLDKMFNAGRLNERE